MKLRNSEIRFDLQIIASWIDPGSKVLGLGCGEGELLHFLKKNKRVTCTGIELNEDKVAKWWLPERWTFIDEIPKTSVGKFDKKTLRARYTD